MEGEGGPNPCDDLCALCSYIPSFAAFPILSTRGPSPQCSSTHATVLRDKALLPRGPLSPLPLSDCPLFLPEPPPSTFPRMALIKCHPVTPSHMPRSPRSPLSLQWPH